MAGRVVLRESARGRADVEAVPSRPSSTSVRVRLGRHRATIGRHGPIVVRRARPMLPGVRAWAGQFVRGRPSASAIWPTIAYMYDRVERLTYVSTYVACALYILLD